MSLRTRCRSDYTLFGQRLNLLRRHPRECLPFYHSREASQGEHMAHVIQDRRGVGLPCGDRHTQQIGIPQGVCFGTHRTRCCLTPGY
jgi:hypothetical protein